MYVMISSVSNPSVSFIYGASNCHSAHDCRPQLISRASTDVVTFLLQQLIAEVTCVYNSRSLEHTVCDYAAIPV